MSNALRLSGLLGLLVLLSNCGGSGGSSDYAINGVGYGFLDAGDLVATGTSVSGTGSIVFSQAIVNEDNNYALRFSLAQNGSVTLVPSASEKLESPISITFHRASNDNLEILLREGDSVVALQGDFPSTLSAANEIAVETDVHGHGHLIFWIAGMEEEFAFTSEVEGNYWGLRLNKATLSAAQSGPAKEEH